jgi:hypothetical protein
MEPVTMIIAAAQVSGVIFAAGRDLTENEVSVIPFSGLTFFSSYLSRSIPPYGP